MMRQTLDRIVGVIAYLHVLYRKWTVQ